MIKIVLFTFVALTTLQGDCSSYNPVCGQNGVTYQNICKCRDAKIDVGYYGACSSSSSVEWVKKAD